MAVPEVRSAPLRNEPPTHRLNHADRSRLARSFYGVLLVVVLSRYTSSTFFRALVRFDPFIAMLAGVLLSIGVVTQVDPVDDHPDLRFLSFAMNDFLMEDLETSLVGSWPSTEVPWQQYPNLMSASGRSWTLRVSLDSIWIG